MTKAEKVAAKKTTFKNEIRKEMHRASDAQRGLPFAERFILMRIMNRPQEKTFYTQCLVEIKQEFKL